MRFVHIAAASYLSGRFADSVLPQRLSAKTNLKLAKLWLDRKEYGRLSAVSIHSCIFAFTRN